MDWYYYFTQCIETLNIIFQSYCNINASKSFELYLIVKATRRCILDLNTRWNLPLEDTIRHIEVGKVLQWITTAWYAVITKTLSSWCNNATRKRKTIACHLVSSVLLSWLWTYSTLTAGRKFAIFFLVRPLTKKVKREECRRNAGKRFQLSSVGFEKKITWNIVLHSCR